MADCKDKPAQLKKSGCAPEKRQKRQTLGGKSAGNADDPELLEAARKALFTLKSQPDSFDYELVRIKKVKVQTVAGTLHTLDLEVKDKNENLVDCVMKIWNRSWMDPPREVRTTCNGKTVKHTMSKREAREGIVGGTKEIENPENDVEIQSFANEALTGYNAGRKGSEHTLHKITRATVQIVAGTLHKIDVQFKLHNQVKSCVVSVWSRPWLNNGRETKVNCEGEEELKFRSKRSLKFDHRRPLPSEPELPVDNTELHEILFANFQKKYNRQYKTTMERQLRLRIFKQNMAKIEELNKREMGTAKYGMNQFADFTNTEFRHRTGLRLRRGDSNHIPNPVAQIPNVDLPESFDWRDKGVISEVKNQGACGSCWAFSVVGNIEGLNAIKTGKLAEFSEQELVDCDTLDSGCEGGLPDNAYK